MKRFYVYLTLAGEYGLVGYIEATCETAPRARFPIGALEIAKENFGPGAEVAVAGTAIFPRQANATFLRVSKRVFVRADVNV